jgi:hypothetical protein
MFPDFLGIGAQKAGTTWLHHNLARHPQIWLPPVKELHYLDHDPPSLRRRLFGRAEHLASARAHLRAQLLAWLRGAVDADLGWAMRCCLLPRSDDWYATLFPSRPGRLCGEICPGYARLDRARVASLRERAPRLKLIYLLRNPLDRAWSMVAMHFRSKTGNSDLCRFDEEAAWRRITDRKMASHGDYLANLAVWESIYPPEQIYVDFFDRLQEEPREFLRGILEFLGVDASDATIPEDVSTRRNAGRGERPPPGLRARLVHHFRPQLEALHARFANVYTRRWLDEARSFHEVVAAGA